MSRKLSFHDFLYLKKVSIRRSLRYHRLFFWAFLKFAASICLATISIITITCFVFIFTVSKLDIWSDNTINKIFGSFDNIQNVKIQCDCKYINTDELQTFLEKTLKDKHITSLNQERIFQELYQKYSIISFVKIYKRFPSQIIVYVKEFQPKFFYFNTQQINKPRFVDEKFNIFDINQHYQTNFANLTIFVNLGGNNNKYYYEIYNAILAIYGKNFSRKISSILNFYDLFWKIQLTDDTVITLPNRDAAQVSDLLKQANNILDRSAQIAQSFNKSPEAKIVTIDLSNPTKTFIAFKV